MHKSVDVLLFDENAGMRREKCSPPAEGGRSKRGRSAARVVILSPFLRHRHLTTQLWCRAVNLQYAAVGKIADHSVL